MSHEVNRISLTTTVARQTPKNEFGQVLKNTLTAAADLGGKVVGGLAGMPIVSAAVSSVTALASGASAGTSGVARSGQAATGIVSIGGGGSTPGPVNGLGTTVSGSGGPSVNPGGASVAGAEPANFDGYLSQMRAESDRSMAMQMQMQQESRDYNTLSNVLKLRHDSAKAAINNIR